MTSLEGAGCRFSSAFNASDIRRIRKTPYVHGEGELVCWFREGVGLKFVSREYMALLLTCTKHLQPVPHFATQSEYKALLLGDAWLEKQIARASNGKRSQAGDDWDPFLKPPPRKRACKDPVKRERVWEPPKEEGEDCESPAGDSSNSRKSSSSSSSSSNRSSPSSNSGRRAAVASAAPTASDRAERERERVP